MGSVLEVWCLSHMLTTFWFAPLVVKAEEAVVQAIAKVVPTKTTGQVLPGKQGGGSLRFIGRIIERQPGDDAVFCFGGLHLS